MEDLFNNFEGTLGILQQWGILRQVLSSIFLVGIFFLFRWAIVHVVGRWNAPTPEDKRRWIVQLKNLSLLILVFGLLAVWMSELRAFAISLVAVAAAISISTKELILCFLGGAYKASAKPFELGDRVEINGIRGEVIDHNFLGTMLLEIGPFLDSNQHSGRQVLIPNSWLLTHPVYNQSIQQEYVLHSIRIPLGACEDWQNTEKILIEAANHECAPFLEPARWSMLRLGQIQGLDLPRVEPRVNFQIQEQGRVLVILRVPALASKISKTEQAIIRVYLQKRMNKSEKS
jgi:small-conductance mechanosensitive channel